MDNAPYLKDAIRGFTFYKTLGDEAMAQVPSDADFDRMLDPESNSIAMIVQHIAGNFRSRYRDFLTTDGEKPDRDRDAEFEAHGPSTRAAVIRMWDEGWAVAMASLDALTPGDLDKTITIRGETFLVVEALNRSVTHTAYHVGQIVFLARHFASPNWRSLSIPKGKSAEFFGKGDFKTRGTVR
jgi:hypothetical protein